MSAQSNKDLFRTYVGLWEDGRIDDLPTVIHDHYVGHAAAGDRDLEGLRQRIMVFGQLYPGARFQIEDQLAIGRLHRLPAQRRQIHNGEPAVSEGYPRRLVDPDTIPVGSAMGEAVGHRADDSGNGIRSPLAQRFDETADSTHWI